MYQLVQSSRAALLRYCETLPPAALLQPLPSFNDSSMRDLMVHIANAYRHWLENFGLHQERPYFDPEACQTVEDLRALFMTSDQLVDEFMQTYEGRWSDVVINTIRGKRLEITPLTLFTHVITHEFHHKGQILSMSRQLGYTPVDTDVIR
ncbi:Uncharacterized damage-inducible protein DinB (forms a four-helix bundle) [Catalinimonas alkaloidigena]|uniref:Uncharacterized damage-inducible protein DinB (Forms a four-helix bundle) n=2 Tax=Catalinimonas alkaloidigena TaxID=1075417 RepID=A0A1G9SFK3_9BACT|nr:Uncharacterized damage-inducible protein DinB (forms a four-helix bundle) [Catalinimonas alkaloidigena]